SLSEALLIVAGIASARQARAAGTKLTGCSQCAGRSEVHVVDDEIVDVGIRIRTGTGEQIVVDVLNVVDIKAPLERVIAGRKGQGVNDLITFLVRQRFAIQGGGFTKRQTVGQCNLR